MDGCALQQIGDGLVRSDQSYRRARVVAGRQDQVNAWILRTD